MPLKSFSRKENILFLLCAGFFCTLFLPGMPVINNIFTAGIFIFSFFYNTLAEKRLILIRRKEIIFMILFYILHIISTFFSHNGQEAIRLLILRVPLLIFPLSIGLLYISPALRDRILFSFCNIVTVAAVVCLGYSLTRYAQSGDSGYLYNDWLSYAIGMQSTYFSLIVAVTIFCYLSLLERGQFQDRHKLYVRLCMLFLLVIHFMLASRISMVTLYAGLLILAGSYMVKMKRTALGAVIVLGLIVSVGLCVKLFPKTLNRFRELEYPAYTYTSSAAESHYNGQLTPDQWNGANIRLAIWQCGWQLAKQHWITGVQLGDKQDKLMEVYKEKDFDFAIQHRRNMHNNYLDIFACFGVIGLLLFVAGYVVLPLRVSIRSADWLGLTILSTFIISMLVESWFDRSLGCLLTGFFFSFIAAYKDGIAGRNKWNMWVVH